MLIFTLKDCLELLIKSKNADPDKYSYSGYGIVFDSCSLFSILSFDWVKMSLFLELMSSPALIFAKRVYRKNFE